MSQVHSRETLQNPSLTPANQIQVVESGHDSSEVSISDMLQIVLRVFRLIVYRIEILIVCLVLAVLLAGLYYATTPRQYRSSTQLMVLQTGQEIQSTEVANNHSIKNYIDNFIVMAKCDAVLADAARLVPPEHRDDFSGDRIESWVGTLRANMTVEAEKGTSIITISYTSKDPDAACCVTDAFRTAYVNYINRVYENTAQEVFELLEVEKVSLVKKIESKRIEIQQARLQNTNLMIQASPNSPNVIVQRVISLNEAMIKARQKELDCKAQLISVQNAIRNGESLHQHLMTTVDTVGQQVLLRQLGLSGSDAWIQSNRSSQMIADKSQLQTMLETYGPENRKVKEIETRIRMNEQYLGNRRFMVNQALSQLTNEELIPLLTEITQQRMRQAADQARMIEEEYERQKGEAVQFEMLVAQVQMLEHDEKRMQSNLDIVMNRLKDIKIGGGMIKTATMKEPTLGGLTWPHLPKIMMIAIVFGSVCGCGIIFLLDLLDDRFRSPDEMQTQLRTSVLAMVPKLDVLEETEVGPDAIFVNVFPNASESESFRTLRTALSFLNDGAGANRLVISSTEPGDGKSTISANVAATFAQSGKKTLLVDADLRRPGLTPRMGLKGADGLSTVLRATEQPIAESAQTVISRDIVPNLDVIPSGPRPGNPMELLGSERFMDLIGWAEGQYDQIIIDCPPTLAVSDPAVVGRMVDGVLLVVRPEKNRRRPIMRAVETHRSLGVNLLGLVINQVESESSYGGYGGYGYGYGNSYGYGHDLDDQFDDGDYYFDDEATDADNDRHDLDPPTYRDAA